MMSLNIIRIVKFMKLWLVGLLVLMD